MSRALTILLGSALVAAAIFASPRTHHRTPQAGQQSPTGHQVEPVTFAAIDVFVDAGRTPLGAYQVEVKAVAPPNAAAEPDVKLIGVEGGDGVFKAAPYYDPAALHENQLRDRIIIAAFSTAADLPAGRIRVARLHVQVTGPAPTYSLTLMTAGAADGRKIDARVAYAPVEADAPGAPGDGR